VVLAAGTYSTAPVRSKRSRAARPAAKRRATSSRPNTCSSDAESCSQAATVAKLATSAPSAIARAA
jgi:hypothetical protein